MTKIVISPTGVANFPEGGGHFWVYIQYLQSLQKMDFDVYWLERLYPTGDRPRDLEMAEILRERVTAWGMGDRLILYSQSAQGVIEYLGTTQARAESVYHGAALLNFNYRIAPELLACFDRTALIDIDPGLLQFWVSVGQLHVPPHDLYFTTGETVGKSLQIPACGIDWHYIRPPVSLDLWPYACDPDAEMFTTVSSWWGGHGRGEWVTDGDSLIYENNKRVTFLEYLELPLVTSEKVELALCMGDGDKEEQLAIMPRDWRSKRPCPEDITNYKGDAHDRLVLERYGWKISSSLEVARTPELYQSYIRESRGEFSCAKPSCMRLQNAWVSDRSLCYLASGKPVVVQHTGPSSYLPDAEGMFRFSSMEEAAAALAAIRSDYRRHSRAARELAEAYFDSRTCVEAVIDRVLGRLSRSA